MDTLANVVSRSDVIVTCTGNTDVVTRDMFDRMAHGTVILNMGHYDGEAGIQRGDREREKENRKKQRKTDPFSLCD